MITLKKIFGKIKIGHTMIDHDTDQKIIVQVLKNRPDLKVYFDGFKTKKDGKATSKSKD